MAWLSPLDGSVSSNNNQLCENHEIIHSEGGKLTKRLYVPNYLYTFCNIQGNMHDISVDCYMLK